MKTAPQSSDLSVPFGRVSKFVRQVTHDVRNGLSAIDLEAAFIAELVTEPEAAEEVRKLRNMISNTARLLRDISQNFQTVTLHRMPWKAEMFFEELCGRLKKQFPEEEGVETQSRLGLEEVSIDLEQMMVAVVQILRNAFQFRGKETPLRLCAYAEKGKVVIELREPKERLEGDAPPETWGTEPMRSARPSGYGLGLYRTRQILNAHKGTLKTEFRDGELITRVSLPVCDEPAE